MSDLKEDQSTAVTVQNLYELNAQVAALKAIIQLNAQHLDDRMKVLDVKMEKVSIGCQQDAGLKGSIMVILKASGYVIAGIAASKGIDLSGILK